MKIVNKSRFYFGMLIFFILAVSYFIRFDVDAGVNYVVSDTLLGILIFHNAFVLAAYLLAAFFLVITGIRNIDII